MIVILNTGTLCQIRNAHYYCFKCAERDKLVSTDVRPMRASVAWRDNNAVWSPIDKPIYQPRIRQHNFVPPSVKLENLSGMVTTTYCIYRMIYHWSFNRIV